MTFLAPLLTALAALGAIPLLIWLLNRRRYTVVRWPALEFLLTTVQKSTRRLQLHELILLLLRTLALVLLALALARPALAGGLPGVGGGVAAVIVLDRSLSMAAHGSSGGASRLDAAKERAQELVAKLPPGSSAALVVLSEVASAEIAEPSQDLAHVAATIAATAQGDGGGNVLAGLGRAVGILRQVPGRREIHLVSDMQANAWPQADDRAWQAMVDELAMADAPALFLADVGGPPPRDNVQIESFAADDELATGEAPTAFTAVLRNRGGAPVSAVLVELWADGSDGVLRQAAGTVLDRLETVAAVHLQARLVPGRRRVQVRLSPDLLQQDDVRQLVVEVVEQVRVLVVDGGGGGAGFLRAALAPDAGPDELFRVTVVAPADLAQLDLGAYQAVVFNDLAVPPPGLGEALRAWLATGHGVILLPGSRAVTTAWNDVLAPVAPSVLAAAPRILRDDQGGKGLGLATDSLVHPVVAFFATPENQPFLAQPRFWQAHGLEPVAGADVVARFTDGSPALVERRCGRGTVLMAAFPSDKAWSDLPLRPAFLVLARRMAQHAALGERPRLNVRVDEPLRLALPGRQAGGRVEAGDPHGRRIALHGEAAPDGTVRAVLAETPFAGFYTLGGCPFAVNPPAAESDLAALSAAETAARLPGVRTTWIDAGGDLGASLERARSGSEIWWPLFALAVACLVAESILVVRWAPRNA